MSKQVENWRKFSAQVEDHIENYVVPQYGDVGDDPVTNYSVADCLLQVEKYVKRFGRSSRPGEEMRDLIKAAHFLQRAADKFQGEKQ